VDIFIGSVSGVDPQYETRAKMAIETVPWLVLRFAVAADSFLAEQLSGWRFKYESQGTLNAEI
jgi:hypothetical protein